MKTRHHLAALAAGLLLAVAAAGAAQSAQRAAAAPVDIPFALEGANIVVDVELKPGHSLPFAFDSGLSHGNIITTEAAKTLGLKANAKLLVRDASGKNNPAALTTVPSTRVGGASLTNQLYAIVAIPGKVTHRPGKPSLAGFLGAPLMKDAVLCIDYEHQTMQRWARRDFDVSRHSSVPMPINHELPTIIVDIDGRKATLIVDSGNDGALTVYSSFAEKYDFAARYPDLVSHGGNSGGGQTFEALTGEADSVTIGPDAVFAHVPLTVIPQGMDPAWGIDGMVGFTVLSRLNPCIDREGQRLMFEGE